MGPIDGTVVPCATAGSMPFLPDECIRVLRSLKREVRRVRLGKIRSLRRVSSGTSPGTTPMYVGIDLRISLLMIENFRSGFVWNTFMRNPEAPNAMKLAGFRNY